MTRSQALAAIRAAGIKARLVESDDPESTDDEFRLTEKAAVQIGHDRHGLHFIATVEEGAGDDWGVRFGRVTNDPVAAAREALLLEMA